MTPEQNPQQEEDVLVESEAVPGMPEGAVPAVPFSSIQQAEDSLAQSIPITPATPNDTGAAQAAMLINLTTDSNATPEMMQASTNSGGGLSMHVEQKLTEYEAYVQRLADMSSMGDPTQSLAQRTAALARLQTNDYTYPAGVDVKALHQAVGAMAFNETAHFSGGSYATGGFDATVSQLEADLDAIPNSGMSTSAAEFANAWRLERAAETPALKSEESKEARLLRWQAALDSATSPEDSMLAIQMVGNEAFDAWKVRSGSFAATLLPLNDQLNMGKVYEVFRKHGVVEPVESSDALFAFFAAGGVAQRDFTNRIKTMSIGQQKLIVRDLLSLYDNGYGADVYVADIIQRIGNDQPNAAIDALTTLLPVASLPGDVALLGVVATKATRKAKNAAAVLAKQPLSPTLDAAAKHAPQGTTEAIMAASKGDVSAQRLTGMTQADAAIHLTPGGFDFTDPSWSGFRGVIKSTSEAAERYINEARRIYGDYASELISKNEVLGRLASYAKATGKAELASGASRVWSTPDGALDYLAVYNASDGRGFTSFEAAQAARKALRTPGVTTSYAYERADGTKGMVSFPDAYPSAGREAIVQAYKEAKADPLTRWSVVHSGRVVPEGPLAPTAVDATPLLNPDATVLQETFDMLSTASPALHAELVAVSGRYARLKGLMEQMFAGKNNLLGFERLKNTNYLRQLSGNEGAALATGFKEAEKWEIDALTKGGNNTSVPLHVLENIPGWTPTTTKAFIEYVQKGQVMWDIGNATLRKRMTNDGFRTLRNIDSGKRVVGKVINSNDWLKDLTASKASYKWAVSLDGKITKLTDMDGLATIKSGEAWVAKLHAPYFNSAGKWVTHQVVSASRTVEEMVPAVVLPQRAFWSPKVHTGNWVVVGITETGDKVAVGMAQSAKWASTGVNRLLSDARMLEKFPGKFHVREVRELSTASGRREGYDAVDGQLHGLVFGARNDELAYFGDDVADDVVEPVTAMFSAINRLSLADKMTEVGHIRHRLTKGAEAQGVLEPNYSGVIGDDWKEAGVFSTDPSKAALVKQYQHAFANAASLLRVNDPVAAWLGSGLNRFGNYIENIAEQSGLVEKAGTAIKNFSKGGVSPTAWLQGTYTRLIIQGRPIRQGVIQRSTVVLQNIYRPSSLLTGLRAQGDLESLMMQMDDALVTGASQAKTIMRASAESLGKKLGMSGPDTMKMIEHWRDLGGYDAVSNHLYSVQHKAMAAKFGNAFTNTASALKRADDVLFGVPGRLGFESGELFTQRTAFLIEAAEAAAKGTAKPTSKAWVKDTMSRVSDFTGNMRSEFRIAPVRGLLTLASQFITYPMRMGLVGMPAVLGGSTRLSVADKLKLVFSQTALFGSSGYAMLQAANAGIDWWKENYATPEQLETWATMPEELKDGIIGETVLNSFLSAATGDEYDLDFSASLAPMGGLPFVMDLALSVGDSNLTDLFVNTKLLKSTGLADTLFLGNIMFNSMFNGQQQDNQAEMIAATGLEMMGTLVPTLDQAWLTAIAYSQDSMLTKAGTPTGEFFSTTKAVLNNMVGIHDASDEQAYLTLRKANRLKYGTEAKKQELAAERAAMLYKLLQGVVAQQWAAGKVSEGSKQELAYQIFGAPTYLIGLLPYDERLLLREELMAYHNRVIERDPLDTGAVDSLASAIMAPGLTGEQRASGYAYLMSRYPELKDNPDQWAVLESIRDSLTNIERQNEE